MNTAAAATPPTVASTVLRRRIRSPRRRTSEAGIGFTGSPSSKRSRSLRSGTGGSFGQGAGIRFVGKQGGKRGAATAEPGRDGALRSTELAGDLLHGQVGDVVQDQGAALVLRELAERSHEG